MEGNKKDTSRASLMAVTAVILNHRRPGDTIACVNSLRRSEGIRPGIIVVDNGSGDGSVERFRAELPGIELLCANTNLGYAGGNNLGIRHALAGGATHVLVLNNDCIVAPDVVRHMLVTARRTGAGIVSPKVYEYGSRHVIQYAGYRNIHLLAQGIPVGEGERDRGQYDRVTELNAAPGCAMLLSRELCEGVGLFDERFFAYSEELDLCRRAREKGFRIIFEPGAHVWHKKAATLSRESPDYTFYLNRGRILYARIHLGRPAFLFVFLPYFLLFKCMKQGTGFLLTGRRRNLTALLNAIKWNIKDSFGK